MKASLSKVVPKFYASVELQCALPMGVQPLYPFRDSALVRQTVTSFYKKYYSDSNPRALILGINPGRLGAGSTGIPFTDSKRLQEVCGIATKGQLLHEPSSAFVYEVIDAFGGPDVFYKQFYISSICPIGFVKLTNQKELNYNYYDDRAFAELLMPELVNWLRIQLSWGIQPRKAIVLGTGLNLRYLIDLNKRYDLFDEIIPLEHPRYVMQYKSKNKLSYVAKYLDVLRSV